LVELSKVSSEKITGQFIEFDDSFDGEGASQERHNA